MSLEFKDIIRLTEPGTEPVTLTEAKEHLRVDASDEDTLITALISAARAYIENYTGRYWAEATFRMIFDDFPAVDYPMDLLIPDIESVDAIAYLDQDQAEQTITSGTTLDADRRQLRYNTDWPDTWDEKAVKIDITAGKDASASPQEVPEAIKSAIYLVLTDLYEHRGGQTNFQLYRNPAADMLAHPYRVRMGI